MTAAITHLYGFFGAPLNESFWCKLSYSPETGTCVFAALRPDCGRYGGDECDGFW